MAKVVRNYRFAEVTFSSPHTAGLSLFTKFYNSSLVQAELFLDEATAASMNAMPSTPS